MSVFLDEPNKRVILSARKCGLMTLSFSVTAVYKNKSENKGWYHGNPDPHYVHERSSDGVGTTGRCGRF